MVQNETHRCILFPKIGMMRMGEAIEKGGEFGSGGLTIEQQYLFLSNFT